MSTTAAGSAPSATSTSTAAALPHFYHYDPSSAAAVVALAFFFSTTALHSFQLLRTRTWYFIPFLIGGFLEWIGYMARTINTYQTPYWNKGTYILQTLCILISPAFLAASMYMLFGRLILLTEGDSRSLIRQKFLTAIFVCGDVLSLLVQAAGGSQVTSTDPKTADLGTKIIDAGLFIQIISFGAFVACSLVFHYRITKHPTVASATPSNPWRKHLLTLYITSSLVFVRCVFRVVMFLQGPNGSASNSEVLFYIFDSILIFIVMAAFNLVHPSEVGALLRGSGRIAWYGPLEKQGLPSRQGEDEVELWNRK